MRIAHRPATLHDGSGGRGFMKDEWLPSGQSPSFNCKSPKQ
jgi:hypothetical protein